MPNLTGQSIGRYHILEQLGEGGMATVYKAYDTRLERNVAFKVLRTDLFGSAIIEQILKRFEREAKSLAKLSHSNIVNILDYGEYEGSPYLVMEYLPGGTLKQKLGQVIFWQEAIQILLPVARGLSYAHQHGVIHRDVKPANILIDENGEPVLTDFGIAKLLEGTDSHTLTASGVGIGTPEYMAPEQGIGAHTIDARADIYSLGIVLYEMVTGRKPYIADTPMAVVLKQMTDPLPRPTDFVPDLPEGVEHILFKALAKQPDDRYPDMNALIAAMESLLAESQKREVPAPIKLAREKATPRTKLSFKLVVAVVGVLCVILAIVFGVPWVKHQFPSAFSEATQTKVLNIPFTTNTLSPSTSTLEPFQPPTLTETPLPTITNTPAPDWATNFAEPILAAIKDRQPDFQDDFSTETPKWFSPSYTGFDFGKSLVIAQGVMRLHDGNHISNYYFLYKPNIVLQIDVLHPITCETGMVLGFNNNLDFPKFLVDHNNEWRVRIGDTNVIIASGNYQADGQKTQLMYIVKGSRLAFYINDMPVAYYEYPKLLDDRKTERLFGCNDTCYFDNMKFWNLDDISNLP